MRACVRVSRVVWCGVVCVCVVYAHVCVVWCGVICVFVCVCVCVCYMSVSQCMCECVHMSMQVGVCVLCCVVLCCVVCACVCACMRACVHTCVHVCVNIYWVLSKSENCYTFLVINIYHVDKHIVWLTFYETLPHSSGPGAGPAANKVRLFGGGVERGGGCQGFGVTLCL